MILKVHGALSQAVRLIALQKDNGVMSGRYQQNMTDTQFAVLYPGAPDLEFGPDGTGKVVLGWDDPSYEYTVLNDVVAGSGGTLYVAGLGINVTNDSEEYLVYAVKQNGDLDVSFSQNGKLHGQFHKQEGVNIYSSIHRIFYIEPQGETPAKLLVLGRVGIPTGTKRYWYPALARYTLDGQLDSTFGELGTGLAIFAGLEGSQLGRDASEGRLGSKGKGAPYAGIVHSGYLLTGLRHNDRIYIAFPDPSYGHSIISFFDDGRVDWRFGTDGILKLYDLSAPKPGMPLGAEVKAIYPSDGKLLLAGQLYKEDFVPFAGFVRITLEGGIDTSFGQQGFQFGPGDQYELVWDIIPAFGRNFLTAGMGRNLTPNCSVYAIGQNGLPDPDFNNGNVLVMPPASWLGTYQQLWDFGDRVLAHGICNEPLAQHQRLLLARFLPDGTLDKSFGLPNAEGEGAGWQIYPSDYISASKRMVVVSDRIYVTGRIREGARSRFACLACLKV